ncbi:MAG: hypothetical protein HBSIN02_03150 [Bacteroidia bacterium]|nr:MAG: hypothetical protein HBSIN02_03150 [Bacteroidia bacterium]
MGLYPQPNQWQCGPFALKHALVALGISAEEKVIAKKAGTHWWSGTDEIGLGRAARYFDCKMLMIRRHDPERARRELAGYLRRGIPALLCVYEWEHWVTVVKAEAGKFILLDSKDKAVLTIQSWSELKNNWVYHERDEHDRRHVETLYDFHPIVPRFRVQTKAKFSIARAKYLRRRENRRLSLAWDDYVADLLTVCTPRTPLSEQVISLGEFLRRHEQMILEQLDHWHGSIDRKAAGKILKNMHFVADTYGLVIRKEDEKRAIAGLTTILTLWAAAEYGVHTVY